MRPLAVALLLAAVAPGRAADLPRSAPEAQGVSSRELLAFVRAADANIDSLHSVMLVRHGRVVMEGWWTPYSADARHQLYSLSKSFTSTSVGIAAAEGKLSADDPVLKFFPDDAPKDPPANLKSMRLTDLLRMNTGHQAEPGRTPGEAWAKTFLKQPVPFKPGTHFLYNTSATYMLSAAVQKATGQNLLDYLTPRLFDPLGIKNPTWETSPQGVSTGGYGLSVRTEDIAKFGQLYLQRGKWEGKQLVPAAWVDAATARQTSNGSSPASDWDQGYGYQFWQSRHGAYRGDGAFGQYCVVLPEQDAVVAITAGVRDMQGVLNLVWDKLLPAMKKSVVPADDAGVEELSKVLKGLTLKTPESKASPAATGKTYMFAANGPKLESLRLEDSTLTLRVDGQDQKLMCGSGKWVPGRMTWRQLKQQPTAAAGAWTAADTYTAKIAFTETPFVLTLKLKFTGTGVTAEAATNVGFGATKEPAMVGKAE